MTRSYKQGGGRFQESFLPPRVEDYVSLENPVRLIDAYVESLDVIQLGFKNAKVNSGVAHNIPFVLYQRKNINGNFKHQS